MARTPLTRPAQLAFTLAALAAAFFCAPRAPAQKPPDSFWTLPRDCAAYFAFDPTPLGPGPDANRDLLISGLRAFMESLGEIDGGGPSVPTSLLTPALLGDSAFRLCLLDAAGTGQPERPLTVSRLAVVVEIHAPAPHDALVGALRAALSNEQRRRRTPAGLESASGAVTTFAIPGDPDWRVVSWRSTPRAFTVALGKSTLAAWDDAPPPQPDHLPDFHHMRRQILQRRAMTQTCLEAWVSCSAIRAGFPESFLPAGRFGTILDAWRTPNARSVMLSIRSPRSAPKAGESPKTHLLSVDVAWSARSQPLGTVSSFALSPDAFPEGTGLPAPSGPYVILLHADWPTWVPLGLDTWTATASGPSPLLAKMRWQRARGKSLDSLTARAGPWVMITPPSAAAPCFYATLSPPKSSADDCRDIFGFIHPAIRAEPAKRLWTLTLDNAPKSLSTFAWTVNKEGTLLTGAWNPTALGTPTKPSR